MDNPNIVRVVAWGLLAVIGIAVIGGFFEITSKYLYTAAGLGMIVFGIWGATILFKVAKLLSQNKKRLGQIMKEQEAKQEQQKAIKELEKSYKPTIKK